MRAVRYDKDFQTEDLFTTMTPTQRTTETTAYRLTTQSCHSCSEIKNICALTYQNKSEY